MIQRVIRQISDTKISANITIATSVAQSDSIKSQLGGKVDIVTEPSRRDTFPAIALATSYLSFAKGVSDEEIVVVMPCDVFTEEGYFRTIERMAECVKKNDANLVLMGIKPSFPSSQFGYIIPYEKDRFKVKNFVEKPASNLASELIEHGALWNGGVFAFKLGWLKGILSHYTNLSDFNAIRSSFESFPKISFDYEVVEKATSVVVVPFNGLWRDLGTWESLSAEIPTMCSDKTIIVNSTGTTVVNELSIPVVCVGTHDSIIAASQDGILISNKKESAEIKNIVDKISSRPMFEERRWGEYIVVDTVKFDNGHQALTKRLTLHPGATISYQRHANRSEVWTFIAGNGEIVLDGARKKVKCGDVITIPPMMLHTLKAVSELTFIEVQQGSELVEEDIERFEYIW